jgi:hypothetical protein
VAGRRHQEHQAAEAQAAPTKLKRAA